MPVFSFNAAPAGPAGPAAPGSNAIRINPLTGVSPIAAVAATTAAQANYSEIIPNLFVGNVTAAQNNFADFDMIVNCSTHIPFYGPADPARQIHLPVLDIPEESEKLYSLIRVNRALERIHAAISEGKRVLIHCHMGAQRSATVAAAYLMAYHRLRVEDAIARVRSQRPIALIWVNFRRTLELIEASLLR